MVENSHYMGGFKKYYEGVNQNLPILHEGKHLLTPTYGQVMDMP
jgi:hypothetical protein